MCPNITMLNLDEKATWWGQIRLDASLLIFRIHLSPFSFPFLSFPFSPLFNSNSVKNEVCICCIVEVHFWPERVLVSLTNNFTSFLPLRRMVDCWMVILWRASHLLVKMSCARHLSQLALGFRIREHRINLYKNRYISSLLMLVLW